MRYLVLGIACMLIVAAASSVFASGSSATSAGDPGGQLEFTQEQADRGRSSYMAQCAECHGLGLNGGMGPALTRDVFMQAWGDRSVKELLDLVSSTMPLSQPGGLEDQTYVDIVVHILVSNGRTPAESESELRPDSAGLETSTIRPDAQ